MCGFSWFGMLCISFTESYNIRKTTFINKEEIDYNADMLYQGFFISQIFEVTFP